jgi:hypothetical protein
MSAPRKPSRPFVGTMTSRKADGSAGSIDAIPVPDDIPDDPREAYTLGYARGSSAEAKDTTERIWRQM